MSLLLFVGILEVSVFCVSHVLLFVGVFEVSVFFHAKFSLRMEGVMHVYGAEALMMARWVPSSGSKLSNQSIQHIRGTWEK